MRCIPSLYIITYTINNIRWSRILSNWFCRPVSGFMATYVRDALHKLDRISESAFHPSYNNANIWKISLSLSTMNIIIIMFMTLRNKKQNSSMPPSHCVPHISVLLFSLGRPFLSQSVHASLRYIYGQITRTNSTSRVCNYPYTRRVCLRHARCCSSCSRHFLHVIESSHRHPIPRPHSSVFLRCSTSSLINATQGKNTVPPSMHVEIHSWADVTSFLWRSTSFHPHLYIHISLLIKGR